MHNNKLFPEGFFAVVVNDDPTQLALLAMLTKKAGLEPITFTNAENALFAMASHAKRYRLIFENSPLGLLYYDRHGFIVDCNENYLKFIGASRDAVIGYKMLDVPYLRQNTGGAERC